MRLNVKSLSGLCVVALLSVAGLVSPSSASTAADVRQKDSRLADAVQKGDKEALLSLLKQHLDVNAAQPDGATALAWAAHWDDLDTANLLIRAGANVNATNDYGVTPLSLACTNGSLAMIQKLLKAGANPNTALPNGETPLMTAANSGNAQVVKSLLEGRANINSKETAGGQTALMWAIAENHPDVVRLLIDHGADIRMRSKTGWTPLIFAARYGDVESARILLAAGADVNEPSIPVQSGTLQMGPIASRSERQQMGPMTPLLTAAASGQEDVGIFLLDHGADPNTSDGIATALHYSVRKGINYIRRDTIGSYDPKPNLKRLAKALLDHGANPNSQIVKLPGGPGGYPVVSMIGATPIWLAAASYDEELVRLLLAHGADPKMPTNSGITPLMAAAGIGRKDERAADEEKQAVEIAKLLIDLGNDVNAAAAGEDNLTALHGAVRVGSNEITQLLVSKGAKMDVFDSFGQTPLSIALGVTTKDLRDFQKVPTGAHPSTAELLLKLGATPLEASGVKVLDVLHSGQPMPRTVPVGSQK